MKIAVIFIGTGQYLNFLPSWHEHCEKNLCINSEKTYFCFTDGEINNIPENIKIYYQEHLNWPYITLLRFNIILTAKNELINYDWILFLDADMKVVNRINEYEIFNDKYSYIGVHHPCHYLNMQPHNKYPGAFETNLQSTACITKNDNTSIYYQGCLWGGKTVETIEMMEELSNRISIDLEKDIIAVWHDESHLNKFFSQESINMKINKLSPSFAFPEDFRNHCNFEEKIIHISKNNKNYHA